LEAKETFLYGLPSPKDGDLREYESPHFKGGVIGVYL